MRFAAVPRSKQLPKPLQRSAASELLRKLTGAEPPVGKPAVTTRPQDLPADLDQRVRLVGEW